MLRDYGKCTKFLNAYARKNALQRSHKKKKKKEKKEKKKKKKKKKRKHIFGPFFSQICVHLPQFTYNMLEKLLFN
jgi:hypothetical protein